MDFSAISAIIGSVGFPITACFFMAYYVKYMADKNAQEMTKEREEHKAEVEELRKVIERNTIVMEKICERLGGDNKNGNL